ncbi:uncharacterized protein H6S33_004604 [Morchella sextelata]|uniref:uncharacterized protein n=1 Tax=Morchella sextelata TaxID=1174677 RepID=UPI001D054A70|nr:uncharacterized protein H6S33_004604 [Morchella sextelata]KAH0605382.1 hypothetical protein H6S33_004604 [Morchella sextelata]
MTSNPTTALQLRHLWAASHLLATTSPSVSAHLATRLLHISSEKGINLPDSVERGVCNACGTVAVWGINSHVSKQRKGKDKAMMVFECQMCGRSRASAVPLAKRRRGSRARKSKLKAAATIAAPPPPTKAEAKAEVGVAQSSGKAAGAQSLANANSRKRAKTRKGNSLSEILKAKKQQQQASSGGGFGLDLMDLMKTG